MRAVDTNVIIRFLMRDDPVQAAKAAAVIGHEPVFLPRTVLLETEWVLRTIYDMPAKVLIRALRNVAGLPGVSVEDAPLFSQAMDWAEGGMDFADALHLAASSRCKGLLTFDKHLVRSSRRLAGRVAIQL